MQELQRQIKEEKCFHQNVPYVIEKSKYLSKRKNLADY